MQTLSFAKNLETTVHIKTAAVKSNLSITDQVEKCTVLSWDGKDPCDGLGG